MTFEQPGTLNRFVAEPLPVNWTSRWKSVRISLPLLAFITICLAEVPASIMLTHGRFVPMMFLPALAPAAFLLALHLVLNELKLRGQNGKRLLSVLDKGINFSTIPRPTVRWPKVVAFWFEDVPGAQELKKLTVEYFGDRTKKFPRLYSMVLDKRDQYPALLSELKLVQQQFQLTFRIELDRPLPARPSPRNPVLGLSLFLAGFLFLIHGVPLFLVPLTHHKGEPRNADPSERWTPQQQEKFDSFIKAHFSSVSEFRHFFIGTGFVLTTIGIGLMICGNWVQRRIAEEN